MTIDEIKKFIEQQKDGKGYLDALNDYLNTLATATKAYKESIKKLQDEAKQSKAKIDTLNGKIEKFADALGVSEESETLEDDIAEALKTKGGTGDASLQRKIERLTKQLADTKQSMTAQLDAEREKRHESMIRSALISELTAQNAVDPTTLVDMFRKDVKVGEDDSLVFGDNKTVKDGISAWLQAHPVFVSNNQKGGAGSGNNGNSGGGNQLLEMVKSMGKTAASPESDPSAAYFK